MNHDPNIQSIITSPLAHRSSTSSTQYITVPNSPINQATPPTLLTVNKSTTLPLSPPPRSIQDDETTQEVDLALAKRHSKPWMNLSPFHHVSQKQKTSTTEEDEDPEARLRPVKGPSRSATIKKIFRPIPERNGTGNATITSIKLDGLIRKHTLPLGEGEEEEKVLYRYAYVYENQRGWARFGTLKFSSRALKLFFHYRDPAAFTKYETFEEEGGKGKTVQIDLPYVCLRDVQLPSPKWAWQGEEWLIDMASDGVTSYDGYEYATSFHSTRWTPIPPKWHTYFLTCCRRRRWLRLMVYLPSFIQPDSSGNFHHPGHIAEGSQPPSPLPPTANLPKTEEDTSSSINSSPNFKIPHSYPHHEPVDLQNIWQSDSSSDWTRIHSALKSMKSDGRRLELWKLWLGDEGEVEDDITGLGRISLERRRMEEERKKKKMKGKTSTILKMEKTNELDVKGKKAVQWTEDEGPHSVFDSAGSGTGAGGEVPSISYFITDEPVALEGQPAPRDAVANVLHEHAQDILSSFVYPDSRAKFHDMLQRCSLLDNLPPGLSFSVSTDFRERLEV